MTVAEAMTAAEVLVLHRREQVARFRERDETWWIRCQGCGALVPIAQKFAEHQADVLRAAGLLAPAPADDVLTAVRRAISDPGHVLPRRHDLGPDSDQDEGRANWSARAVLAVLGQRDAEVLEQAAAAINLRDADTIRAESGALRRVGPTTALDVIRWLNARARRVRAGQRP